METETKTQALIRETISALRREAQTKFDQIGLPPDRTRTILGTYAQMEDIDHAIVSDHATAETEARGRALRWLVDKGCDITWQVDSDELYTAEQIAAICGFVASRPALFNFITVDHFDTMDFNDLELPLT